jgi:hypothetical protein
VASSTFYRHDIPERATHLVRGYIGRALLAEVWAQGWGTVETEIEVFKSQEHCDRIEVQWLGNPYASGPLRARGHVETVWTRG